MSPRAMWKAVLRVGDEAVPVKLYAAAVDRKIHFRLLHRDDLEPIRQRYVHPETGEEVERDQLRRGFEIEPGRFAVLDDDDLARLEPPASREVEILRFVPTGSVVPALFDRPYLLGPDGTDDAYAALASALAEREVDGLARWVMRKRRYVGLLRRHGERLALVTLRDPDEVAALEGAERPSAPRVDRKELDLADKLIEALAAPFEPAALVSETRDRLRALVDAKARGEVISIERAPEKEPPTSLTDALRASLRSAGGAGG